MATHTINIKDLTKYQLRLGAALKDALRVGLLDGAKRCIPILHRSTEQAPPASPRGSVGAFNLGQYKRAWKTEPGVNQVRVYNDSIYAGVIEDGRRPGAKMPPVRDIESWAKKKLKDAGAAYNIARAIGRRGLSGRKVLANAVPQMKQAVNDSVIKALELAIEKAK